EPDTLPDSRGSGNGVRTESAVQGGIEQGLGGSECATEEAGLATAGEAIVYCAIVKRTIRRRVAWLFVSTTLHAYSVLSHEAIIDSAWDGDIRPTLLKRFPNATPEELNRAHAHAYGGCIIQDMGYYPFGSRYFSELAHYVRSGDFLVNLLKDAQTLDEYAFALGALAHYAADRWGHSVAVNRAVPMQYPKLAQKFGPVVTY